MIFARLPFLATFGLTAMALLSFPEFISALSVKDIPNRCDSVCSSTVNLLNGCGLRTDGSNVDETNSSCFCSGARQAQYGSCVDCVRDGAGGRNDNDDDERDSPNNRDNRKRSLEARDLLSDLLNIDSIVCDVSQLVNDVTSVVVSVATSVVGDATSLLLRPSPTSTTTTREREDREDREDRPTQNQNQGTITVTATRTVGPPLRAAMPPGALNGGT